MNNNTLALQWTSATTNARVSSNQRKIRISGGRPNVQDPHTQHLCRHSVLAPNTPAPNAPPGAAASASPEVVAAAGTNVRRTLSNYMSFKTVTNNNYLQQVAKNILLRSTLPLEVDI